MFSGASAWGKDHDLELSAARAMTGSGMEEEQDIHAGVSKKKDNYKKYRIPIQRHCPCVPFIVSFWLF